MKKTNSKNKKTENGCILAVDDSQLALEIIQRNLVPMGYKVITTTNVDQAIKLLESEKFDLVISDLKMPNSSGMELITYVRENYCDIEIIMITGYATIDSAVEAIKTGAEAFIQKPFTDEELQSSVSKVFEKINTRRFFETKNHSDVQVPKGFIGNSTAMREVYVLIEKSSKVKATVLITGESGTGKELVARSIHYNSHRALSPFVAVNCGGIPESLLESELFGHVKGAFTGADETRAGFFQTADTGTIFLDEIGEMSQAMQIKLLRVLQENEVYMVGSKRPFKINVRVIAATNKKLSELVEKGRFREDLFYRLNVINIELPPLRKRNDDVLLLIQHFSDEYASQLERNVPSFSDKALNLLKNYAWPGNVRELQNLINRLMIIVDKDYIDVSDLPTFLRKTYSSRNAGLNRTLEEVAFDHIRNVLASVNGNKTKAAKILGITRKSLREKVARSETAVKSESNQNYEPKKI